MERPDAYDSIICDGMQQATCLIPRKRKFAYDHERLSQKLVGINVHRQGK